MIVEKLTGTRGIVIVDESDHLTYDAIEELRYIQEKAEVGFALIGNDRVYTRMQGELIQPTNTQDFGTDWAIVVPLKPVKRRYSIRGSSMATGYKR